MAEVTLIQNKGSDDGLKPRDWQLLERVYQKSENKMFEAWDLRNPLQVCKNSMAGPLHYGLILFFIPNSVFAQ